eukprot:2351216-Pleurochrysis_carterae.AAC.1
MSHSRADQPRRVAHCSIEHATARVCARRAGYSLTIRQNVQVRAHSLLLLQLTAGQFPNANSMRGAVDVVVRPWPRDSRQRGLRSVNQQSLASVSTQRSSNP